MLKTLQVESQRTDLEVDRPQHRGQAEDEQDVDEVGPDDVPHRETGVALTRGIQTDRQLGQARAQRHDGHADDDRVDAQPTGDRGAFAHDQFRAEHEQREPGRESDNRDHVGASDASSMPVRRRPARSSDFRTLGRVHHPALDCQKLRQRQHAIEM
jgi:hypothetical protein